MKRVSVLTGRRREERTRVMLPARMRSGTGWSDACILNISSRGLLVYSNGSAQPGSFVEIRRGGNLVVARVVWRENQRIGLCSPDPIPIEGIVSNEAVATAVEMCGRGAIVERRRQPRCAEQSRARARAAEFLALVLIGTALAGSAAVYVQQALARPLTSVNAALRPR